MKAVVQRVIDASVRVAGRLRGQIGQGLLVYLGVARDDAEADADWLAEKIANLRIFNDAQGKMNCSLLDVVNHESNSDNSARHRGTTGVLAVSQFTLLGDARKGRRPSWGRAAPPEQARALYEYFMDRIRRQGLVCESGEFQAHMSVAYTNDGPVTILLDSAEISSLAAEP
jgi:D-tyrosyl-tRNA(Tyr) deacylase